MSGSNTLTASQALPLISQYESNNQNVLTSIQPPGGGNTASGYYQIVNGTWQQYAPQAGVSLAQYPTAMSAPQSVQTQVATVLYNQQGFGPWSTNAALMSAVAANGGTTTLPEGTVTAQAPSGGSSSGGLLTPLWELLERGAVIMIGLVIVAIALAAMLMQSKTVAVPAKALSEFPA
jgi:hypothetical protein